MGLVEFGHVAESFAAFHREFAPLFGRPEAVDHAEQYVRGLLAQQTDRRNAENISEVIDGVTPRGLQRFLTDSPWSSERVIDRLQRYVGQQLTGPEGIFVIDGSEFQAGQEVGRGHTAVVWPVGQSGQLPGWRFSDLRLRTGPYPDRCPSVPATFVDGGSRALPSGGRARDRELSEQGRPGHGQPAPGTPSWASEGPVGHRRRRLWQVPTFRDVLDTEGWLYVLEVPYGTPVFSRRVKTEVPAGCGRGPKPSRPRLVEGEPGPMSVEEVAQDVAAADWRVLTVADGAQRPRNYEFAAQRVWESRDGLPRAERWLVLRRNLDGSDLKCYLSNAPADTLLSQLAHVGSLRWCIETDLQIGNGEPALTSMKFAVGKVGIIIWSWLC